MRLGWVKGAVAAALLSSVGSGALAAPPSVNTRALGETIDPLQFDAALREGLRGGHEGSMGCGGPLDRLLTAAARPEFDRLPVETRRLALRLAAGCTGSPRGDEATALVARLEPLADTPALLAEVNAALLTVAVEAERWPEAGRRMVVIVDNDPDRVAWWWPPYVSPVVDGLYGQPAVQRPLLQRLTGLSWEDKASAAMARNEWALAYADLLLDAGDRSGAERALARADEIDTLSSIAQERRYAWLWASFAAKGRFDWGAVAKAEAVRLIAAAEADSDDLRPVYDAQYALRRFGRYDEAIAMGRKIRGRLDKETFEDRDEMATRVLWELGLALLDKGQVAEAEAAFKQAIAEGDKGGDPVTARLHWATRLNSLGRHEEALKILDAVPAESDPAGPTPYGAMRLASERVCALTALDRPAWTALASMLLREAEHPAALEKALLCMNKPDEAAALYVQRLSDPGRRLAALAAFRRGTAPPVVTPYQAELNRRRAAVQARPEVTKALNEAGRAIEAPFPWNPSDWF